MGIRTLDACRGESFVAILDDDDEWDEDHLAANLEVATREGCEIVVSGLRMILDGRPTPRPLPAALVPEDFLVGNPGWQGSNTFVRLECIRRVGGFRDGLLSLNDRDIAVRLLRLDQIRVGYTRRWTATWHHGSVGDSLSVKRSPPKISGLRWFWAIYGPQMSKAQAAGFFQRAEKVFHVQRDEIESAGDDVPPHTRSKGDLRGNPRPGSSFARSQWTSARWEPIARVWFRIRARWRHFRISRPVTALLGAQYRRSRDKIEIDITYACNLHCLNCNRSVSQAPEALHMPLSMVAQFVDDSIRRGKRWMRIRVLGGEPTVHPQFAEIIGELQRYRAWHPECLVEVVTNGHGEEVRRRVEEVPPDIWVENSAKTTRIQPSFGPFNMAPVDDPAYRHADYSNGCAIMRDCGMGLTPTGYYPCAVAGGIDRITGDGLGQAELPEDSDDMEDAAEQLCRLCGRFRDGHFVPRNLRPALLEARISPTWSKLYSDWRRRRASTRSDEA